MEELICVYCGKQCKNKNSLAQHKCRCKNNPNRLIIVGNKYSHSAWNKGLTKETDERLVKQGKSYSEGVKSGRIRVTTHSQTSEVRQKLSRKAKENILSGKVIPINHSRAKHGWYKGYYCDSSWELAYLIYNLEHGITISRNKESFEYSYENKSHLYFPDFKLNDTTYVEIKGYATKKDIEKWKAFPDNYDLIIINHEKIKIYLDYVISKYGEDFYTLYEV